MTDHPALSALTTSTAIPTIAANTLPPMSFVLPGADGQPLVSISLTDGSIEYGPNYEPDEAARVFWAAMQAMFGSPEAVFGHGLAAKVDAEMAGLRERAEKAEAQVGRVRNFLEDMAGWCSPHGIAADYARRGLDVLEGVDPLGVASTADETEAEIDAAMGAGEPVELVDLPELTAEDAVEAMEDMAGDLYKAEDRLAFVREMCDLADRNGQQVTTGQVRSWLDYNGCANATPDGASLAQSLGFAMAAMQPGAEPVFCQHEHRTVRWRTSGGITVCTATCSACPARAESTEGEPVLAPYLVNAERCTDACTEQHTYRAGCLVAPDFSKPILRSKP